MKTWYQITNLSSDAAEVKIYDDIGAYGVSAKQFCGEFNAIKAAKIDLRINSYGGEVFDAAAICTAIAEHPAEVTAHVDGIAASAASVVAAACDSCQIGKSAFLMIHNPQTVAFGNAGDMRKSADMLDKLTDSIARVYSDKTGKTLDECKKAMDEETWFDCFDAVKFGLADSVKDDEDEDEEDESEATDRVGGRTIAFAAPLLIAKYRNVPQRLRQIAARANTHSVKEEQHMPNQVIARDGKFIAVIDGKEVPVELTAGVLPSNSAAPKTGKSDEEVEVIAAKRVKDALQYESDFSTAMNAAGLTGDAAKNFRKTFHFTENGDKKWDIDAVKFCASQALAARATAVGEGSGEPEKKQVSKDDEAIAKVEAEAGKRFDEEPSLRRTYGVTSKDTGSDQYKSGRGRYVAAARRRHVESK